MILSESSCLWFDIHCANFIDVDHVEWLWSISLHMVCAANEVWVDILNMLPSMALFIDQWSHPILSPLVLCNQMVKPDCMNHVHGQVESWILTCSDIFVS